MASSVYDMLTDPTKFTAASSSLASSAAAGAGQAAGAAGAAGGGQDYFDGKSVITDPQAVIDIATIIDDNSSYGNLTPETMEAKLKEKGYNVTLTEIDGRKAVQFENGDFFIDSDGDGNLGTKDQNFQTALTQVEQTMGVDLSKLKNSSHLAYHEYSEIGKGETVDTSKAKKVDSAADAQGPALMDINTIQKMFGSQDAKKADDEKENPNNVSAILADVDAQLEGVGYNGGYTAFELWQNGELDGVLGQFGIAGVTLPETGISTQAGAMMQASMSMFGAALGVADERASAIAGK